jgi:UDP-glucose 4-epimerase
MKILITGGNGFLGSHLVREFLANGHTVHVYSKNNYNLVDLLDRISFTFSDNNELVTHKDEILAYEPDAVIHCGWSGGNSYADTDSLVQYYDNVESSINLIQVLGALAKKPHFIGFGSFAEYGNLANKAKESDIERPINLYGLSKLVVKNYSQLLCNKYSMDWTWIRPCYVYGPGDVKTRLFPTLIRKFSNNEDVVLDECNTTIDYLYIDDFVNYMYELTTNRLTGVYNLCSGMEYDLKTIIQDLHSAVKSKSKITFDPTRNRSLVSKYICGDNSKLSTDTKIASEMSITDGLLNTINYEL